MAPNSNFSSGSSRLFCFGKMHSDDSNAFGKRMSPAADFWEVLGSPDPIRNSQVPITNKNRANSNVFGVGNSTGLLWLSSDCFRPNGESTNMLLYSAGFRIYEQFRRLYKLQEYISYASKNASFVVIVSWNNAKACVDALCNDPSVKLIVVVTSNMYDSNFWLNSLPTNTSLKILVCSDFKIARAALLVWHKTEGL